MITLLKALALQLIAGRTVGGAFSLLLLILTPLAAVLKFIGLPILLVLGVVGAPVFLLLGALGLPVALIIGVGGTIVVAIGLFLVASFAILKIALPIILVVLLVRWLFRRFKKHEPVVVSAEG